MDAGHAVAVVADQPDRIDARPGHVADVRAKVEQPPADVVEHVAQLVLGLDPAADVLVQRRADASGGEHAGHVLDQLGHAVQAPLVEGRTARGLDDARGRPDLRHREEDRALPELRRIRAAAWRAFSSVTSRATCPLRAAAMTDSPTRGRGSADAAPARTAASSCRPGRRDARRVKAGGLDLRQQLRERRQQRRIDPAIRRSDPLDRVQRQPPLTQRPVVRGRRRTPDARPRTARCKCRARRRPPRCRHPRAADGSCRDSRSPFLSSFATDTSELRSGYRPNRTELSDHSVS